MQPDNNDSNTTGNVPPQNVEAERSVLGGSLIEPDAIIDVASLVSPGDFYEKRHGLIFAEMLKLFERNTPVDIITVTDGLRSIGQLETAGGASYLAELSTHVASATNITHYAKLVRDKSIRRRLIRSAKKISELGFSTDDRQLGELVSAAESELFRVTQSSSQGEMVSIETVLTNSWERLDEMANNKGALRGVPTGFRGMDNKLAGMQPSDLIILAARPSMGKTAFALNIAQNVALSGRKVLFFSLEMSKDQLVDRMLSSLAGVDAWNIRTGQLSDEQLQSLSEAIGELSEAQMMIDDTPGITPIELRTKAMREAQKAPVDLVVVDYLQLMTSQRRGSDNRVQEISDISLSLKSLARELDVPVIALSQLSRSVDSRSPQIPELSDLRESGSIEQDADLVMFIYREDYYNPDTSERPGMVDIFIKKHRNGPTGRVELYFQRDKQRFLSVDTKRSDQPEE